MGLTSRLSCSFPVEVDQLVPRATGVQIPGPIPKAFCGMGIFSGGQQKNRDLVVNI